MPDCINGIPYARGACIWPPHQVALAPAVTQAADGSIVAPAAGPRSQARTPGPVVGIRPTGQSVSATFGGPYDWAAMLSAWAMLDEHDQRILDAGQIPDLGINIRRGLWIDYYNVSYRQFRDDETRLAAGQPPQITFSADGIAPYGPERLADVALAKSLGRLKTADQLALDEIIRVYGAGRTAADISAKLATNPFAARLVQLYIEAQLPAVEIQIRQAEDDGGVVVTSAPPAAIGDISQGVKIHPNLPGSPSNTQTYDQAITRIANQAKQVVALYPEEYLKDDAAAAKQQAELRDFFFWKANYPRVQLLVEYNPVFQTQAALDAPWQQGYPPLVNVTFTPRVKPLPKKPLLSNPLISAFLEIAALAIPAVGPIISAGITYASNTLIRKWAQEFKLTKDDFAPQYALPYGHGGEPFNVPMPIDRAQLMVREPWYGPAMVDQFAEDVRVNELRQASANYAVLLQNAAAARAALVATGTNALTSGMSSSNATQAQGAANIKGTIPSSITHAQAGGALPILLAGALLVAGAPIAVPIGVLVLLGKKK